MVDIVQQHTVMLNGNQGALQAITQEIGQIRKRLEFLEAQYRDNKPGGLVLPGTG